MGIKYKISYTPFTHEQTNEFTIPESAFLHPVKISDEAVAEIIHKEPVKDNEPSFNQNKHSNEQQSNPFKNLTWARKQNQLSKPASIQSLTQTNSSTFDLNEIKRRQMMAESSGNAKAVSRVGAKGLYQIMDATHQDYIKATGNVGDIFDPDHNTKVRDWYMDWLGKHKIINTPGVSDKIKMARQLAAYNWGIGNLQKFLNKKRNLGVDVDNSLDWVNDLPEEPKNYIHKILLS